MGKFPTVSKAKRSIFSLAIIMVSVSAVWAQAQGIFNQQPQDPYRDLTLSEFSSPANPYLCEPNKAYAWGCAFFSGWNLDLERHSVINFKPELGAIQETGKGDSYIVEVTDPSHWIADTVVVGKNGKSIWEEQSVTVTDAKKHTVQFQGDSKPERLFGILHPPTPVHAYIQKSSKSVILTGGKLKPGESLSSPSGNTVLTMQTDGDLVLTSTTGDMTTAIWSTGTAGNPGAALTVQPNGDVVISSPTNDAIWSTGTAGNGPVDLTVQDDPQADLVDFYGRAIWSTN